MKPAWWSPWTWRRHGQTPWFLVLWGSSHLEDPARKGPTGFGKLSAFRGRLDPGWGLDAAFNGEFCKSGGKHREIKVDLRCKKKPRNVKEMPGFTMGRLGDLGFLTVLCRVLVGISIQLQFGQWQWWIPRKYRDWLRAKPKEPWDLWWFHILAKLVKGRIA